MKRKELQALCKEHGIPANLKNREMADRLALLLKVAMHPLSTGLLPFPFYSILLHGWLVTEKGRNIL